MEVQQLFLVRRWEIREKVRVLRWMWTARGSLRGRRGRRCDRLLGLRWWLTRLERAPRCSEAPEWSVFPWCAP